jgi:hypothetical protein
MNRYQAWPAEEAPAGFTDRTVAAIVRERRRRRWFRGRHLAIAAAMAAVLAGGAAFGLANLASVRSVPTARSAEPKPAPPDPLPKPALAPPLPLAPPPAPAAPSPSPRRRVEAPAPVASAPDAGRKIVMPRCYFSQNEAMCDSF